MTRYVVLVCSVLMVAVSALLGRQSSLDFGRWRNFTDMKSVRAVAATADSLWVATAGGLFLYVPSTHHFARYTNSDGLSSNDLTAVSVDKAGTVWVGSSEGYLNGFNPRTGAWKDLRNIAESDRIQKSVRSLYVHGDSLFIGTDFGITVLQVSRGEFRDTYANMGFATQSGVNDIRISRNRIWVATDLGVASAQLDAPNLSAPNAWTTYGSADGLPTVGSAALSLFHDTLFVGTTSGLVLFDGTRFQLVLAYGGKSIVGLSERDAGMVVLWNEGNGFAAATYAGLNAPMMTLSTNTEFQASSLALDPSGSAPWIGTTSGGIARLQGSAWEYRVPNGPQSNLFSSIVVDEQGVLWGASGISGRGRGFYRYDPAADQDVQWKNYTVGSYPAMKSDDYYKVSLGANGSIWVSSWGWGIVEVAGDSIRRHLDQTTNPALAGAVPQDPNYVVTGGVAVDSKGNTWMVNRGAINGNVVVELKSTGETVFRSSPPDALGKLTNIVVDHYNTKWFANSEPSDKPATALYYFNEDSSAQATMGTSFLGGWGVMNSDNGLLDNNVLSLAVDLDGDVCVGTDVGMMIFTDPLRPRASKVPAIPLRGQVIQAIAVDAVNNKWVGTKEGVLVVNPDATQLLTQYTVVSTNGKLMDDDIRSIAFDQKRGIVYIGTEKGLSSLEVTPVQTVRTLSSIELGPNPFIVPSQNPLMIKNLAAESSVKILSTDGRLMREFVAQGGGRAFWDGRDSDGLFVPSGIYFVVAFADNGNQTSTAKVAVIRR